jgi:hypothetical protein
MIAMQIGAALGKRPLLERMIILKLILNTHLWLRI